ncbi:amino acid permease-domain-containing protein [Daldinia loculata]|uniref:amino acid permease-domain-containing protein n=1 Tax=Daldinia loculata TaxID=103429 RepID=UPI0020C2CF44|nr:amino acid permease-domain-containing protein [Daldinia loculata]KAI1645506.1 amino acid permease-domain-containing protein [Daldinia loculata]
MTTEATRGRSHTIRDSSENLDLSLEHGSGNDAGAISIPSNNETRHLDTQTYRIETLSPIRANTKKGRVTHRRLLPIHVFMIAVNATLGTGLYWRGGQILELGGFLAVIISFLLLGILSWLVTQCITELLCIWPVPGAMSVFVREFVDFELGITVGVAYWFTYSVSFAALIAYTAEEVHYWTSDVEDGIDAGVLYLLVPVILIVLNCFGIHIYGWFEVATGIIKLIFLAIIGTATLVFATKSPKETNEKHSWAQPVTFDDTAAQSWFPALCICLSTATFAYVGVEVPAAAALEARPTTASAHKRNQASNIGETVRFPSKWISVFACIAYTLGGILVSLSVDPTDCRLPRVGWLNYDSCETVQSAFVLVAKVRGNSEIASAFNAFLVFTALSCANTNLYVASRTLFGLTNQIDGGPDEPWYLNILAWLGRTNSYRVPIRAMTVSAIAFIWVPFLQLLHPDQQQRESSQESQIGDNGSQKSEIGAFINILAEMGSVGVLIAWACECLAFIRYYHCISKHRNELVERKVSRVQRFSDRDDNDYPYISNGQPFTAYLGLAGCLLILLVLDGAALWNRFYVEPFLSSYLIVAIFLLVWVALKLWRGAKWSLVDLSNPDLAIGIIRGLHESSYAGFQTEPNPNRRRGSSIWALRQLSITPSAPARNDE